MVNTFLVQLLILAFSLSAHAKIGKVHSESYLGEKSLDSYSDRYQPLIFQDIYQGKMFFEDELFFQNYFQPYLLNTEKEFSFFLKSELNSGLLCSNELLSKHFDDIRYSYRLIALSYFIEGGWQLKALSDHLRLQKGCQFDIENWVKSCRPKSAEMKKFVARVKKFRPKNEESFPKNYTSNDWWSEFNSKKFKNYTQHRMDLHCKSSSCSTKTLENDLSKVCVADQEIMTKICSEEDEIYGLSLNRDAYFLLGLSNIINTYNKSGEAMGCLRRFSEVMSHKEVRYDVLKQLFPPIQAQLRQRFQERYLQGRLFLYGSSKEFEDKGLSEIVIADQPLKVPTVPDEEPVVVAKKQGPKIDVPKVAKKVEAPKPSPKKEVVEIKTPQKSAFLQAAEEREARDLLKIDVDMLKLKYDYVFTLTMINSLSQKLKTFMTRDALTEMMTYDKLGSREGPVPLLFIKFMIDMEEHQGLYNLISVLGNRFYVSNEIDESFKPGVELVQLVNDESTKRQWQIVVLKP